MLKLLVHHVTGRLQKVKNPGTTFKIYFITSKRAIPFAQLFDVQVHGQLRPDLYHRTKQTFAFKKEALLT
jgi:hypothetical protein